MQISGRNPALNTQGFRFNACHYCLKFCCYYFACMCVCVPMCYIERGSQESGQQMSLPTDYFTPHPQHTSFAIKLEIKAIAMQALLTQNVMLAQNGPSLQSASQHLQACTTIFRTEKITLKEELMEAMSFLKL